MAVRFATNVPMTFSFPFGDHLDVNGQYGPQHMYTVQLDGVRDKLFAPPALHKELQAAGVGPGSIFTITKIEGEGNRKGWLVQPEGQNGQPAAEEWAPVQTSEPSAPSASSAPAAVAPPAPAAPASATPQPSRNGQPAPERPDFAALQLLMNHALQASWLAWHGLGEGAQFSGEDVRAVGITLFLECARKGIVPQPEGEELPF